MPKAYDISLQDWVDLPAGYTPPPEGPAPVPNELSFPQLIAGLVAEGWITKNEGKAWVRGTLPAIVQGLIDSLPENQQMLAEARAIAPSVILRNDPLVTALGNLAGRTSEQIDDLFRNYSVL